MNDDSTAIMHRLKRLEGQVRGLQKMIEEQRECTEVLTLLSGVRSALDATGDLILERYLQECTPSPSPSELVKVVRLLRK